MHPLEKFKYCPVCGSKHFEIHDEKSKKCENCGFEYYLNPSAATAAIILNENNELLVLKRKREPAKGTLDLPGGFCDLGETGEEGVRREVKEETGLDVIETRYLFSYPNTYLYSGFTVRTLDLFFVCKVKDDSHVVASDDAQSYQWVPLKDIHTEQFGMRSIRQALSVFLHSPIAKTWEEQKEAQE
ncbi:MAG: NUDIX domain-containing protein [Prevotella sp.]|nr:NUDIX domain-containing protein [Prevotella sp.]